MLIGLNWMQACRKQANPSSASELLQSAGWWRPHEQLGLIKSNRVELFPAAVQVLPHFTQLSDTSCRALWLWTLHMLRQACIYSRLRGPWYFIWIALVRDFCDLQPIYNRLLLDDRLCLTPCLMIRLWSQKLSVASFFRYIHKGFGVDVSGCRHCHMQKHVMRVCPA